MIVNPATGQVVPAGTQPKKFYKDLIRERREEVRALMAKGMTSPSRIAKVLGVCEETARQDIKAIHREDKEKLTRKAARDHMLDMISQLDQVIVDSSADLMALKESTPRSVHVRSALNQTKLRAIALKAQLLMQTSVIPQDITNIDKILEGELAEARVKETMDPSLAAVAGNIEARRKVLDVIEKIKGAAPEAQEAALKALEEEPIDDRGESGDRSG